MVGIFVCLVTFLRSVLVESHDFPKELSVVPLIWGEKWFPLFNELFYLGPGIFLNSTIFEERHLVVIQLISSHLPETAFKKTAGFRLLLSSFLQCLGICAQKVNQTILWKKYLGGMGKGEWGRRKSWVAVKAGYRARIAPHSDPMLKQGIWPLWPPSPQPSVWDVAGRECNFWCWPRAWPWEALRGELSVA